MKRHAVLAVVAAPVLVLSFALAAQGIGPDDQPEPGTEETQSPDADDATEPTTPIEEHTADPTAPGGAEGADEATVSPAPLPEVVVPEDSANIPVPPPVTALAAADVRLSLVSTDVVPGAVLVAGFVEGVEADGVCTATLSRPGESLSIEAPAEADATTTVCGGLTMSTEGLASDTWSVVLSYRSATQAGTSSATNVVIG